MAHRKHTRRPRWLRAAAKRHAAPLWLGAEAADFELCAEADPAAANTDNGNAPRVRKFSMTAYTGGTLQVEAYYWPVVVDLAGLTVNTQRRPILYAHDPAAVVGHTETVEVTAQRIRLTGKISGVGDKAAEVVATADNGFPWQASIGASVEQLEFVDRGNSVKVNGTNFTGPLYVARRATLREVSFVAIGADDFSSATVAATLTERRSAMGFDAWLQANGWDKTKLTAAQLGQLRAAYETQNAAAGDPPADDAGAPAGDPPAGQVSAQAVANLRNATAAEIERQTAIRQVCAEYNGPTVMVNGATVDLAAHAIRAGWTRDRVELHALRAARPRLPAIHVTAHEGGPAVLAAAVATHGRLANLESHFTPQTLEAAHRQYRGRIGLQQLLLEAAWQNGYTGNLSAIKGDLRGVLRAAFSSSELSTLLTDTGSKFLLEAFRAVEGTWRRVCAVRPVSDFKTVTSYRLTGDAQFTQVGPDGKLAHGTLGQDSFANQAKTYGKIYGVTRTDIINDNLGALADLPRKIGRGAGQKLNDVFWTAFLDNSSFFTTGNKNYFTGAGTALQSSSLATAEQKFLDQVDQEGKPLGIMPAILLVPTALAVTARELYASTNVNTGGASTSDKVPNANVWAGRMRPEVSAYLGNSAYSGYSAKAWYLLADPLDEAVMETVFLNGQEEPTVETADADFDELGISVRGYFDFGCAKREPRAGVKAKGEA